MNESTTNESTASDPKIRTNRKSWLRTGLLVLFLTGPVLGALLSFVEVVRDGVLGVTGLGGVSSLALSPDGRDVYAVGSYSDALTVFTRDATTDLLTFVEAHQNGVDGLFGLLRPSGVAASSDCRHVYAVAEADDTLTVFRRSSVVHYFAAYDAGLGVPVCAEAGTACNSANLLKSRDNLSPPEPNQPNTLDGCADGTAGTYETEESIDRIVVSGPNGVSLYEGATVRVDVTVWARPDRANDHLDLYYAADATNPSWVLIGTLEPTLDGAQVLSTSYTLPAGSLQAIRANFRYQGSPSTCGGGVYDDTDDLVFAVAPGPQCLGDGKLNFVAAEVQEDGVGPVFGLKGASGLAVSDDGKNVYVTAGIDDAVAVFARDASSDALTFVEAELNGVGGVEGLNGAAAVAVSGDGAHVYVASETDDAVAVFARDAATGALSYLSKAVDSGLSGASGVTVSPDDRHVYATGRLDNALVAFDRDTSTGALTLNAVYRDGVDGVDGLNAASWVAVNPSGTRVLVAGTGENAVALFRRTPATGALALLTVLRDGVDGVDGLAGVASLVTTDIHTFAAGKDEDAIARFYLALCEGDEMSGDSDEDAFCDDIDLCMGDDLTGDVDGDGVCGDMDICAGDDATLDSDSDGVCDGSDACAGFPDGADADGDGVPDGCDVCVGDDATLDSDSDGVCDDSDACYGFPDSIDADSDGVPDGCDLCTGVNATGDADGDGVCGNLDCAPADPNVSELDTCGVCGGDGTGCVIFSDGFESGSTSVWSGAVGG